MPAFFGVGAPGTVAGASGGKVYAWNTLDAVTPLLVAPANTARRKITFHNPGTVDVFVFPQYVQTTGSDVANTVTVSVLGGALRVYANGGQFEIDGECSGAWYALAASGSANPLTVIDTNIS